MKVVPPARRSSTTRASTSARRPTRSTSSCSRRTAASASSTRPRSPSWRARSGCRRASRSATSRARSATTGSGTSQEQDAHAWPEVWLGPTVGWYRFEPTPGRTDPVTGLGGDDSGGAGPTDDHHDRPTTPGTTTPTTASLHAHVGPDAAPACSRRRRTPKSSRHARARDHRRRSSCSRSLVGALLAVRRARSRSRAWRRTRRRRHDPDARRRVLGAWTEALERLAAAGIERRPVDHVARVRAAPGARARRGRGRSAAHGPRAPAHRRDVLARRAVGATKPTRRGPRSTRSPPRCARRVPRTRRWRPRLALGAAPRRRRDPIDDDGDDATTDDGDGRGSAPSGEPFDERGPLEAERAHVGVDVGRDLIDRDEQRELAGTQRVEDLAVVVARPHVAAVGDEPQARQVVAARRAPRRARRGPGPTAARRRASSARRAARRDRGSS